VVLSLGLSAKIVRLVQLKTIMFQLKTGKFISRFNGVENTFCIFCSSI